MHPSHEGAPREISATDGAELVREGAVLLDVREDHEWVAGHAPQAIHIAMSTINQHVADIPTGKTIVCICHVGGRSARVAWALNQGGWEAMNLSGGMQAWAEAGLPVVDEQGAPGFVV